MTNSEISDTSADRAGDWCDVFVVEAPEPTLTYRTGWVVYEESLSKGNFVGFTLMKQGIPVRLEGALTSELLICEAIDDVAPVRE